MKRPRIYISPKKEKASSDLDRYSGRQKIVIPAKGKKAEQKTSWSDFWEKFGKKLNGKGLQELMRQFRERLQYDLRYQLGVSLAGIFLIALLILWFRSDSSVEQLQPAQPELADTWFGIPSSQIRLIDQQVFQGEDNLVKVLQSWQIPDARIQQLIHSYNDKVSFFDQMAGNRYVVLTEPGNSSPQILAFESGPTAYFRLGIGDSLYLEMVRKETQSRQQQRAFLIRESLGRELDALAFAQELAQKINSALAWKVDLFHLQPGTLIKMIYSEKLVAGQVAGIDQLEAIMLHNNQQKIYAFFFDREGYVGYFDQNGLSTKTSFMQTPVKFTRISSGMGSRINPISNKHQVHLGTDFAAPSGTPIYAVADGKVLAAAFGKQNGNYVKLQHEGGYVTWYLHMQHQSFGPKVQQSGLVKQGDLLGLVGSTGSATGPHVCFRVSKNNRPIDPTQIELPKSKPLPPYLYEEFSRKRDELLGKLDQIGAMQ